jgi:arylsulfatase
LKSGGYEAIAHTHKIHLDVYNVVPLLTGKAKEDQRKEISYFSDDGDLPAQAIGGGGRIRTAE